MFWVRGAAVPDMPTLCTALFDPLISGFPTVCIPKSREDVVAFLTFNERREIRAKPDA
jgi:hypothetical protein